MVELKMSLKTNSENLKEFVLGPTGKPGGTIPINFLLMLYLKTA
jgi:hypothetical protein